MQLGFLYSFALSSSQFRLVVVIRVKLRMGISLDVSLLALSFCIGSKNETKNKNLQYTPPLIWTIYSSTTYTSHSRPYSFLPVPCQQGEVRSDCQASSEPKGDLQE